MFGTETLLFPSLDDTDRLTGRIFLIKAARFRADVTPGDSFTRVRAEFLRLDVGSSISWSDGEVPPPVPDPVSDGQDVFFPVWIHVVFFPLFCLS